MVFSLKGLIVESKESEASGSSSMSLGRSKENEEVCFQKDRQNGFHPYQEREDEEDDEIVVKPFSRFNFDQDEEDYKLRCAQISREMVGDGPRLSEQIRVDLDIEENNKKGGGSSAQSLLRIEFPNNDKSVFDFDCKTCSNSQSQKHLPEEQLTEKNKMRIEQFDQQIQDQENIQLRVKSKPQKHETPRQGAGNKDKGMARNPQSFEKVTKSPSEPNVPKSQSQKRPEEKCSSNYSAFQMKTPLPRHEQFSSDKKKI